MGAGQTAGIPAADPGAYWLNTSYSNDDWDQWVASRDARDDNVSSARYVSREMDGAEDLDQYGTWETFPGYGPCWVPTIPSGVWAPYTFGRWAWVAPWGWTWIDEEPWGFAPFHYGRWALVSGIWVWAPGAIVRHPVYAPALVTWIGQRPGPGRPPDGSHIAWAPLGPRQPFHPLYEASPAHIRAINGAPVPVVVRRPLFGVRRPVPFDPRTGGYIPRDGRVAPGGRFVPGGPVPRGAPYPHPRGDYRPAVPAQMPPQGASPGASQGAPGSQGGQGPDWVRHPRGDYRPAAPAQMPPQGVAGPRGPQVPPDVRGAPPQRGGSGDDQNIWRSRGGGRFQ